MKHLMDNGNGKVKRTTATLSSTKKPETIVIRKREEPKPMSTTPKKKVARVGMRKPVKKVAKMSPPKEETTTLTTMVPKSVTMTSEVRIPDAPDPKTITSRQPEVYIDRKRVRRLITARSGGGLGARQGQSMSNKIQRTKDKIKRFVSPWMGGTDYYAVNSAGKAGRVSKEQYKELKKAGAKTNTRN